MKLSRRQFPQLVAGVAALPIARVASAETYPARPIRLVVPFPSGGAFDTLARPWVEQVKPLLARCSSKTSAVSDRGGGGLPWPDQSIDYRAGRTGRHAEADHRADRAGGTHGARGTGLPAEVDRVRLRSQSRHNAREIPASPRR